MNRKVFLSFFIFHFFCAFSQEKDSLLLKLSEIKNNEDKINMLYTSSRKKGVTKETIKKVKHILDSFSVSLSSERDRGFAIFKRGKIEAKNRDFNSALTYYYRALKLIENSKDVKIESLIHADIGMGFYELKNFKSAIDHYYTSLNLNKEVNSIRSSAGNHCILGNIFKDQKQIDSSLFHHEISLALNIQINDSNGIASAYNDIGLTYKRDDKYELALDFLIKALKIREALKNERGIAGANINIGNTLKHLKRYKDAMPYFEKGIEVAEQSGNTDFYLNGIIGRAKNSKKAGDFKLAAEDFSNYIELKDSLYKQELNKQLAELEVSYQTDKKDNEIILQQQELKLKSEQNSKQKVVSIISIISLLLALVAVFFISKSYRQNKLTAIVLASKNHLIAEKNKEITDSINYARLIQQSLLASESMLSKNLNEYFVLYKPKDIVSGDFYWAEETLNGFLMACVDCTGHGVPGAFMSLIGKENLDKAIVNTNSPKQILKELNKGVKKSLNQNSVDGNKDGMDAVVIRIEKDQNGSSNIFYSGANRSLVFVRKETGLLEEIKATKQGVGGYTRDDQEFEEHEVILKSGDVIYLSTDGFADQFGSDKNKKLTTKRFKDFLLSIHHLSAIEQKKSCENFFNSWKGRNEQLDDVLLIGIRV
ncbi:MAG: tetratricopeptide repeat protein [Bacteroidota bacterium]|nr:tetratricopeptide repeat protein [Bacteroidota bacterium]